VSQTAVKVAASATLVALFALWNVLTWTDGTALLLGSAIWGTLVLVLLLLQFERSRRAILWPVARLKKRHDPI
jgi:hypothetical protein